MRSDAIKPGDVIAGKYRVRAIMSRSRGFLVEAFHTEFDQRVAIRILSPHIVDEKEVERFRREARTLAKLESEHVARILDVGQTQDGAFFFARQYLEGQDLGSFLKQRGALPLAEAVLYILQAAEAVAETHVHSIILRELQPAHLFLTQRIGGQQVKIIDFGTAKLMRDAAAPTAGGELTATSMFGLSCYSSPELVRKAQHVDVRTDVWSLGAILYQLLTARPPFAGEMAALMLAITRDEPVPVTRYRRDLPQDIDKIINWALAKDPDGRFANVHGFAHALTPFASPEGQLLVQRIGQITAAGKQRRQAAPAPSAVDRDHPITIDGSELVDDEDADPRTAYRAPDAPVASPGYHANVAIPQSQEDAPPLERTVFIAPPPAAASSGRPSQPAFLFEGRPEAARPSQPAWQPMPGPPPAGRRAGRCVRAAGAAARGIGGSRAHGPAGDAGGDGHHPVVGGAGRVRGSRGQAAAEGSEARPRRRGGRRRAAVGRGGRGGLQESPPGRRGRRGDVGQGHRLGGSRRAGRAERLRRRGCSGHRRPGRGGGHRQPHRAQRGSGRHRRGPRCDHAAHAGHRHPRQSRREHR